MKSIHIAPSCALPIGMDFFGVQLIKCPHDSVMRHGLTMVMQKILPDGKIENFSGYCIKARQSEERIIVFCLCA